MVQECGEIGVVARVEDDKSGVDIDRLARNVHRARVGVSAESVCAFVEIDVVGPGQVPSRGEAGNPGTDDGNF